MTRWRKIGFALRHPVALWRAWRHLWHIQRSLVRHDVRQVLDDFHIRPIDIAPESLELLYRLAARGLRDARCLPRSIAVFQNLAARGIPARHVIGVPSSYRHGQVLTAHAWVEWSQRV